MIKSIENAIQRVKGSYPSIYSKDDVVNLLIELTSDLDTEIHDTIENDRKQRTNNVSEDVLEELEDDIYNEIIDSGINLIDDYDLEMNYREVDLVDVTYNKRAVREMVQRLISEAFPKADVEAE